MRIESEHCKRTAFAFLSHQWPFTFSAIKTFARRLKICTCPNFANNWFALLGIDRILHLSKRNNFPLTAPVPFILFYFRLMQAVLRIY
jgi:hypothetical protein